jgi:hypothetical protein
LPELGRFVSMPVERASLARPIEETTRVSRVWWGEAPARSQRVFVDGGANYRGVFSRAALAEPVLGFTMDVATLCPAARRFFCPSLG